MKRMALAGVAVFLLIFGLCAGVAQAQNEQYSISGRVLDFMTRVGAPEVLVKAWDQDAAPAGDPISIQEDGEFIIHTGGRGIFSVCLETEGTGYLSPAEEGWDEYGCRPVTLTVDSPAVDLGDILLTPKEEPPPPPPPPAIEARFEICPPEIILARGKTLYGKILRKGEFFPGDLDLASIKVGKNLVPVQATLKRFCYWKCCRSHGKIRCVKKYYYAVVFSVPVDGLGLVPGDTNICFEAATPAGVTVQGCDGIVVKKPCGGR